MTEREYLLARVLAEPVRHGPILVLKGPKHETWQRHHYASTLGPAVDIAEGENTWEEVRNAALVCHGNLTLVTSAYHQLRAFLTFVKALDGKPLGVWNAPAPSVMHDLDKEFSKICEYQQLGHVATFEEALRYLAWRDAA